MNDQLAERLCVALEQIALELAQGNDQGTVPAMLTQLPAQLPQSSAAQEARASAGPFAPLNTWACPEHGSSKLVPAGISPRTGKPYTAFIACDEYGCNQKPPKGQAPQRAQPPSEGVQGLPG